MSEFEIEKDKIKFNPDLFKDEVDAVVQARDYITIVYKKEIADGGIIYFQSWDYTNGEINFNVSI